MLDITAVFCLVGSIVILYVAYLQLQNIVINLTGHTLIDVSKDITDEIRAQFVTIQNELKQMSNVNMTFADFLYKSIDITAYNVISYNVISVHTHYLQLLIQEIATKIIPDFTQLAMDNCIPHNHVVDTESWNGLGKYINRAINGAIISMSTTDTSVCIMKTSQLYIEKTIYIQQTTIGLLFAQINMNTRQISNSIYYGIRIGTCSFLYILYRAYPVVRNIRNMRISD